MANYKLKGSLKLTISQLDKILIAVLNNSENKKFIRNVQDLFDMYTENSIKRDYEKEIRVLLIQNILTLVLENNLGKKESILSFINCDGKNKDDLNELLQNVSDQSLSDEELSVVDKLVVQHSKCAYVGNVVEMLQDKLTSFQTENYDDVDHMLNEIEESSIKLGRALKSSKETFNAETNEMILNSTGSKEMIAAFIEESKNPSARIRTGLQFFNEKLDGGFENGRVYLAIGMAKGWKSGFLGNAALWALLYNDLKPKNKNLRPVVLYVTMENTIKETMERYWTHFNGNNDNMADHDADYVVDVLRKHKIIQSDDPNDKSPILKIEYVSNKSINTYDLELKMEELEKEGMECVFLIQDYIKRIRAAEPNKELRLELGNIADEFSVIAKKRKIPVLTAMQLNRDAFREFDSQGTVDGKFNAFKKMGAAQVGESIDLVHNVDYAFTIARADDIFINDAGRAEVEDSYLFINCIANRGKGGQGIAFKHRFKHNNGMSLMEDVNAERSYSVIPPPSALEQRVRDTNTIAANTARMQRREIIVKAN